MSEEPAGKEPGKAGGGRGIGERLVYVMPEQGIGPVSHDEFGLRQLWSILWVRKWVILALVAVFSIGAFAYSLSATEWYRAETLIAPVEDKATPSLSGELGGLAALAGVAVGGNDSLEALAVLRSREFAASFIDDLQLVTLFFADDWDAEQGRWSASNPEDWPDVRDAVQYFHDVVLNVSEDRRTRIINLAVEWKDPDVAAVWASVLVERLNHRMRERALREAQDNVNYLRDEITKTNVVALQESIGRLLESELQKLMLARGSQEFSFHVIDKAVPPKDPVRPKRALIVAIGALLGGILGTAAVLIAYSGRTAR